MAAVVAGAGRIKVTDTVDFSAGIEVRKKLGDAVKKGESGGVGVRLTRPGDVIATVYSSVSQEAADAGGSRALAATTVAAAAEIAPLVRCTITKAGVTPWTGL